MVIRRNISRAIVLGAGASCSYSESPTGLRPPLAKEIIKSYGKLDISENRYVLVGHLINYVRDTRGVLPSEFGSWDEDVETFFSEVDEEVSQLALQAKRQKRLSSEEFYRYNLAIGAYNQMIFLFASIFNEIQNGPISIPYMLLASELKEDDIVITFNWDTLLDRALMASDKWSPSNGYCIRPEAIFEDGWTYPDINKDFNKGPLYVKLHGSTNWLAPYHGVHLTSGEKYSMSRFAIDKLYVFINAERPYKTYEGRYCGPYEPFSYCYYPPNLPIVRDDVEEGYVGIRMLSAVDLPEHGKYTIGEKDVFSMPLIVPPVRNKQYQRYGEIFSTLWKISNDSLCQCEELYIIGYSFPNTDTATRKMFKEGLSKNTNLRKVIIINPYPEDIKKTFTNEFKIRPERIEVRKERFEIGYSHNGGIL
jgi:hypothetical protein